MTGQRRYAYVAYTHSTTCLGSHHAAGQLEVAGR